MFNFFFYPGVAGGKLVVDEGNHRLWAANVGGIEWVPVYDEVPCALESQKIF